MKGKLLLMDENEKNLFKLNFNLCFITIIKGVLDNDCDIRPMEKTNKDYIDVAPVITPEITPLQ